MFSILCLFYLFWLFEYYQFLLVGRSVGWLFGLTSFGLTELFFILFNQISKLSKMLFKKFCFFFDFFVLVDVFVEEILLISSKQYKVLLKTLLICPKYFLFLNKLFLFLLFSCFILYYLIFVNLFLEGNV